MATLTCPSCGKEAPAGTMYCRGCGQPVTAPIARKPDPKPVDIPADSAKPEANLCPGPGCGQPLVEGEEVCGFCGEPVQGATKGSASSAATLVFPWGEYTVKPDESITLGRSHPPFAGELAGYGNVGRSHARIELRDGELRVTDLNSQNHTFLDGRSLAPDTTEVLRSGQVLRLAATLEIGIR
jgi:hypothetical protein